ncbi:glycosyltransferase [Autumnicola musiva]|uniref:Glycosyltransferase n=1 Tax=Autumnicola musiva TaxID=3075589 RepID=A0ABU3D7Q3_9FLAO|nr:glycosyltransferase [Zunongwangia sp. F117]MDT0677466.1 glycosyltransferase [Zunongwangia sp. F117]
MKILQLVTSRQYRGAEVFAANLSAELIELGHQILFVGLYKNDQNVLSVKNAENLDIAEAKTSGFSISLLRKLIKLLKEKRPAVVQCNGSDTLKYMAAASLFVPKVPVLYRNISMISKWVNTVPKKVVYKRVFRRIDHVSSVGEEAVVDFINTFNYPRSKTSVIRRGIPVKEIQDQQLINRYKQELGISAKDKVAIHIGNFSPEKNHTFLLDVFSSIKQKEQNVKLFCVGSGVLYEEIEEQIKQRDLEDTVYLLGFRKDIPELLAAADCFVLSSKVEGVPGVILEAATQRKPSVATNVGGVSEVLSDGKTGYLINNFDLEDFEAKLLKLLMNKEQREEFGENAYRLVFEEFNPKKNALRFQQLYLKLENDQ